MKLKDGDVIKCTACPMMGCTGRPVRVRVVHDPDYPTQPDLYHDGNAHSFGWVNPMNGGKVYSNHLEDIEIVGQRT